MAAPAILAHTQKFYDLLNSKATDEPEGRVYSGQITAEFYSLGLPSPYYTRVTNLLKDMDCAEQLQRGGRANPSRWLLKTRPTQEIFAAVTVSDNSVAIHERIKVYQSATDQRLRDMKKRVEGMETSLNHVSTALAQLTQRVNDLAATLNKDKTTTLPNKT